MKVRREERRRRDEEEGTRREEKEGEKKEEEEEVDNRKDVRMRENEGRISLFAPSLPFQRIPSLCRL